MKDTVSWQPTFAQKKSSFPKQGKKLRLQSQTCRVFKRETEPPRQPCGLLYPRLYGPANSFGNSYDGCAESANVCFSERKIFVILVQGVEAVSGFRHRRI